MDDQEFLDTLASPHAWNEYLARSSEEGLAKILTRTAALHKDYVAFTERVAQAQEAVQTELIRSKKLREQTARKGRRQHAKLSLRAFLSKAQHDERLLEHLALCTKTGATVRLTALTFKLGGTDRRVTTVKDAAELLPQSQDCSALWELYYVRNGTRSAPYGWERPFLDELLVLESYA